MFRPLTYKYGNLPDADDVARRELYINKSTDLERLRAIIDSPSEWLDMARDPARN